MAKRGTNRGGFKRKKNKRKLRKLFLIVCEGEKTEPNYFRDFRVPKKVYDVIGTGHNTLSLVREAIRLKDEGDYDQVWVVMDRDSFPVENFNNALNLAREKGISVAYSNEAFELWYLLHFHFHNIGLSRHEYQKRLTNDIGRLYRKNDPLIYDVLEDKQIVAIENAKRLLKTWGSNGYERNPVEDNPSTTVHRLVEALRDNSSLS